MVPTAPPMAPDTKLLNSSPDLDCEKYVGCDLARKTATHLGLGQQTLDGVDGTKVSTVCRLSAIALGPQKRRNSLHVTCRQNVASIPLYNPNGPSLASVFLITSLGLVYVLALSCNRILTNSNGVTTKDSVAPAAQPVIMARDWVMGVAPFEVNMLPQYELAATARFRMGLEQA